VTIFGKVELTIKNKLFTFNQPKSIVMKNLLSYSLFAFLLFATNTIAQTSYTIAGEQLSLKTEAEGTITLLWNTIDGEYRYFLKKGTVITELKNTRVDKKFNEEYKQVLQENTNDVTISLEKVKLTTASLRTFFINYNSLKDPNFSVEDKSIQLNLRLGAFVGVTNSVYSENTDNSFQPTLGFDFEIVDENILKRHSLVFQFKQTFETDDYKYAASDFSLNYRFKFIKKQKLDVFINTKFAGYSHVTYQELFPVEDEEDVFELKSVTGDDFQALLNFGLGVDYALGNGYLSFVYNDIVSLTNDSNGEFPLDFTLGYKINL